MAYGTGWMEAPVSTAPGIPDVNGDGIPDIRARDAADGQTRLHYPSRTSTNPAVKNVLSVDRWTVKSLG